MYVPVGSAAMPRRTKADALRTRERILDKAEQEFLRRGVSRTTLQHIARAAGVTRGAIYWHFQGKSDLFNAMMNRVTLPLEREIRRSGEPALDAPLAQIRGSFLAALKATMTDPQARRVIEIALHKVEHTAAQPGVRERRLKGLRARVDDIASGFRRAARRGQWQAGVPARTAAVAVHSLVDGLIQNWLLDPGSFNLLAVGRRAIDALLDGLRRDAVARQRPQG